LQYTTAASAGAVVSETVASAEKAVKATAALIHFDLFNMTSLLFQADLRRTDRSPQPMRRYMGHGEVPQHPTNMGVWPKRADLAVSGLKTANLKGSPDAMNMAWTAIFTSTMVRALNRTPAN